jgi:FkbM family methyltransferase
MRKLGIQFFPPNYIYFDNFNELSVIVDVGCGHEAEFSKLMIEKHNLNAFGVDPTMKHTPALKMLEESTKGKFHHLAIAVTKKDGFITFHESRQNESGSILLEHINMQNDEITTYNVESVSLSELVRRIGTTSVDFIKLDIEGAEYELLDKICDEDINPFKQIFIEFHHHCTNHSTQETKFLVQDICSKGFKVFTLDHHNYLFYKQ